MMISRTFDDHGVDHVEFINEEIKEQINSQSIEDNNTETYTLDGLQD